MGKKGFTIEEKIKAIGLHIHDGMGYGAISDKYGVPITTLRHWIRKYQTFGTEGLMQRKGNQSYSAELKRCAVEEYLSGMGTLHDICVKYKIHSDFQLRNWIKMAASMISQSNAVRRNCVFYCYPARNSCVFASPYLRITGFYQCCKHAYCWNLSIFYSCALLPLWYNDRRADGQCCLSVKYMISSLHAKRRAMAKKRFWWKVLAELENPP